MRRCLPILFIVMLGAFSVQSQVFKVRDNKMWISISRNVSKETAARFIQKYALQDIGLWQLVTTGKPDSLKAEGWSVAQQNDEYHLTKALQANAYPRGKAIFSPVPTPDNWREVGGNRTTWGFNDFKENREFTRTNGLVNFHLPGFKDAKKVRLAGSFTNWQHAAFPMTQNDSGWTVQVKLEPGQYYYKFIIGDGRWITDPANRRTESDGRGNVNSVYFIPNQRFVLKNHLQANSVYVSGSFNNWSKDAVPMQKNGTGWYSEIYIEEGTYNYHFLVDGEIVQSQDQEDYTMASGQAHNFVLKGFPQAKKVILTGNFVSWNEHKLAMKKTTEGWELPYVLGVGNYQYKFIVDGRWMTDPGNPLVVQDNRWNQNSFLVIGENHTFSLKGFDNAKEVRITGDFTEYSPTGIKMKRVGNQWQTRVYLGKGKHRYRFIVDGTPKYDPDNKDWESENGHESFSIIWIDPNDRK